MPDIDQATFRAILDKRPQGMTTDEAVRKMVDKGYTFGGKSLDPKTLQPIKAPEESGILPENPLQVARDVLKDTGTELEKVGDITAEELGREGVPKVLAAGVGAVNAIPGKALQEASGMIPTTPTDVAILALADPLGAAIGKAGKTIFGGLETRAPNVVRAVKSALSENILPSPAQIMQSKPVAAVEEVLSKLPFVGQRIVAMREAQDTAYNALKNRILNSTGQATEAAELGEATRGEIADYLDTHAQAREKELDKLRKEILRKHGPSMETDAIGRHLDAIRMTKTNIEKETAGKLYDAVDEAIPDSANKVMPEQMKETAGKILKEYENLPSGSLEPSVKKFLEDVKRGPGGKIVENAPDPFTTLRGEGIPSVIQDAMEKRNHYTFGEVQTLRSTINSMVDKEAGRVIPGQMTQEGRLLLKLKSALDRDIETFSDSLPGDVQNLKKVADANYASYKGTYANETMGTLAKSAEDNPEEVYRLMVKPGDVSDLRRLKAVVGSEGFVPLRRKFVDDLITGPDGKLLDSATIQKNIAKYTMPTMKEILTPGQLKDLLAGVEKRELPRFVESELEARLRSLITQSGIGRAPEEIVKRVVNGDTATAKALSVVVGPQGMAQYRRTIIEEIIGAPPAEDLLGGVKPGPTSYRISKNLESYDPKFLEHMGFGKQALEQIRQVEDIKALQESTTRLAANVSGTGSTTIAHLASGGLAGISFYDPVKATMIALSADTLSRFYVSRTGRELLIKGLNPKFASDVLLGTRIAAFIANAERHNAEESASK